MTAATFEFVSYLPQPAPNRSVGAARTDRTATPVRGWFSQDNVLRKISTALLGLAEAPANAAPIPSAHELVVTAAQNGRVEQMMALRRTLIEYKFLTHDWDGYDGQPAKATALLDVLEFLVQLPHTLPVPSPMLSGSGAIGLYWDRGTHYASLEFEGDGTYTSLTDGPDGYGGAEGIAARTLPAALQHYLASLPIAG
ncbi:hypothetical protein [Methyloversatilis sp.]|uniref:hypothetical protein n=1 Tax=Methyloversatilis sp. TaxID=2569862 RepID=UPI002736528C|nr:hypothetical protein [Methyloversatilis sp.]MDP2869534.1 hypothetical protein [Methyloversatilis sp.]MDP3456095.1 hypothetical protein [Methyloversatilis sp.]MDP3577348.1 hypothetical protein [Methyloversatilis sp.]